MCQKLRSRLTFANVVSVIALVVALGGTGAWATHEVILSSDIRDGEVKTPDLANLGVTNPKLGPGSVTSGKLADSAVTNPRLGTDAVTSGKVLNNNLQGADLLNGTVATADLAGGAVTPAKFGSIPAARVQKNSSQTVASSPTLPPALTFDRERFDTANLHSGNDTRLVAPISGLYQASAGVDWRDNATGDRELTIDGAGPSVPESVAKSKIRAAAGGINVQSASGLVKLNAGDYIRAHVYQDSGVDALADASSLTFLAMTWVGPG